MYPDSQLVTRDSVVAVLTRSGIDPTSVADVLDSIRFPAPLHEVAERFGARGVTRESLLDALGGSP